MNNTDPFDDLAYDLIADLVGSTAADEIVARLTEAGFIIIPEDDEATLYELEQRELEPDK